VRRPGCHVVVERRGRAGPAALLPLKQLAPVGPKGEAIMDLLLARAADDLYPVEAFAVVAQHIRTTNEYAMVAFRAGRTIVNDHPERRAGVDIGEDGRLNGVEEATLCPSEGFDEDSWISVNLWGFQPSMFDVLAGAVASPASSDVYLPDAAGAMIAGGAVVRVLLCELPCVGITRADDVDAVRGTLV
jgi:hypothetical protein